MSNTDIRLVSLKEDSRCALVSPEDHDRVISSGYKWFIHHNNKTDLDYVDACVNGKTIGLHRFIMNPPKNMVVDHKNGNPLDNRRSNLRVCTRGQNAQNRDRNYGSSGYRGVYWFKRTKRWVARGWKDNIPVHLGYYDDPVEASEVVEAYLKEVQGEYYRERSNY